MGFLQCTYRRNGQDWPSRRHYLAALACSMTGQRLRVSLGDPLYRRVYWSNASPRVGLGPSAVFPADLQHMAKVLADRRPRLILTYGRIASEAVFSAIQMSGLCEVEVVVYNHPNARGLDARDWERYGASVRETWEKLS